MEKGTIKNSGRRPVKKVCSYCGRIFFYLGSHASRNKHFFCCNDCYLGFKTKKIKVTCDRCGKKYMKKRSAVDRTEHNFCTPLRCLEYRHKQGESACNHQVNGVVVHRRIVEDKLGRVLRPWEEVHHIDGNHFNNNLDNLQVVSKSEHAKIHATLKERGRDGRFVKKISTT